MKRKCRFSPKQELLNNYKKIRQYWNKNVKQNIAKIKEGNAHGNQVSQAKEAVHVPYKTILLRMKEG